MEKTMAVKMLEREQEIMSTMSRAGTDPDVIRKVVKIFRAICYELAELNATACIFERNVRILDEAMFARAFNPGRDMEAIQEKIEGSLPWKWKEELINAEQDEETMNAPWGDEDGEEEEEETVNAPVEEARLLCWADILTGVGSGLIEEWIEPDPTEGTPERIEIQQCAWAYGHVVTVDGPYLVSYMSDRYNLKPGARIWKGIPTAEDRENAPWGDDSDE